MLKTSTQPTNNLYLDSFAQINRQRHSAFRPILSKSPFSIPAIRHSDHQPQGESWNIFKTDCNL